jgi:hypothetical protein
MLGHVNVKGPVEWGVFFSGLENSEDFPVSDAGEKFFGLKVFTILKGCIQVVVWAATAKFDIVINALVDKISSLFDIHGVLSFVLLARMI